MAALSGVIGSTFSSATRNAARPGASARTSGRASVRTAATS
jgi:hypothetical protein